MQTDSFLTFLWICECNGFTKEAAVMQQDGIAEDEENRGTWMAEATPAHTEKRLKIGNCNCRSPRYFVHMSPDTPEVSIQLY
jgi:hypothetical protein